MACFPLFNNGEISDTTHLNFFLSPPSVASNGWVRREHTYSTVDGEEQLYSEVPDPPRGGGGAYYDEDERRRKYTEITAPRLKSQPQGSNPSL